MGMRSGGGAGRNATARAPDTFDELCGLEQRIEVGASDHAGRVERRVGRACLAGERAGMGDRRRARLLAASDLHHHDRLAELERTIGERDEALGPTEAFEEEDD